MKPIIITGILLLGALSFAAADEPNAKSILQKSADAINQLNSFKADMIIDSFASLTPQKGVVYQKKQPDGTIAMRMEMAAATNAIPQGVTNISSLSSSYTLVSSQGTYTVMGNRAFSMNGISGMEKLKNAMSSDALKKMTLDAQINGASYTLSSDVVNGKDCWVIAIPTTPAALEAVKKLMSSGPQKDLIEAVKIKMSAIPLPAQTVLFFDKQSYLMVKQESLDSNNKVLQSMVYQNMQTNIEISDQIFKLPENVKIEDMNMMMQSLLKKHTQ